MTTTVPSASHRISCLCGAISLSGSLLSSPTIPVPTEICHCNPCRYASGLLLPSFPTLKSALPLSVMEKLTSYQTSRNCIRYFCSTCGTKGFVEHPMTGEWYCTGGMIEPSDGSTMTPRAIINITAHCYIDDTIDGGLLPSLLDPKRDVPLFPAVHKENPMSAGDVLSLASLAVATPLPGQNDKLEARCHCSGVSLLISRADYLDNRFEVGQDVIPSQPNKYLARHCGCRSCRLATGTVVHAWALVPPGAVTNGVTGSPVNFGRENEGLKFAYFHGSRDVEHSFCSVCSATVFYRRKGQDSQGVVGLSVGILRARSGSLAREWLQWDNGRIGHGDEILNEAIIECIRTQKW